jgi:hypothetical protein
MKPARVLPSVTRLLALPEADAWKGEAVDVDSTAQASVRRPGGDVARREATPEGDCARRDPGTIDLVAGF